ncbi:hypothetical protein C8J56DRAFT_1032938 [Mycena floridula]|nr:hypothetical protein C8J56DRAFT_1032938 [Mycena floridula]
MAAVSCQVTVSHKSLSLIRGPKEVTEIHKGSASSSGPSPGKRSSESDQKHDSAKGLLCKSSADLSRSWPPGDALFPIVGTDSQVAVKENDDGDAGQLSPHYCPKPNLLASLRHKMRQAKCRYLSYDRYSPEFLSVICRRLPQGLIEEPSRLFCAASGTSGRGKVLRRARLVQRWKHSDGATRSGAGLVLSQSSTAFRSNDLFVSRRHPSTHSPIGSFTVADYCPIIGLINGQLLLFGSKVHD